MQPSYLTVSSNGSSDTDQIAAGRDAWQRICQRTVSTFDDWVEVGRALVIGRAQCFKLAGTNRPFGKQYTAAMAIWLRDTGLESIRQQERYWVFQMMDNLDAIERWRAGLDDVSKRRHNHPHGVWVHWRRSLGLSDSKHSHRIKRRDLPSPTGQSVYWPQETIRRAALAMKKSGSNDFFALAVAALHAAIRNDADLIELLVTPKPKQPKVNAAANVAEAVA